MAIKAFDMREANNDVRKYILEGEKKALTTIESAYVAKARNVIQCKDYCYFVMERYQGGTLKDYISSRGRNCL